MNFGLGVVLILIVTNAVWVTPTPQNDLYTKTPSLCCYFRGRFPHVAQLLDDRDVTVADINCRDRCLLTRPCPDTAPTCSSLDNDPFCCGSVGLQVGNLRNFTQCRYDYRSRSCQPTHGIFVAV